jgi:hypothetical protein
MAFTPWAAGERITAARLNEISPTWSTWTPVWTTDSGVATPSFGNANIIARYTQTADLVVCRLEITFGSTTNFGGGGAGDNWQFSLPVTAATTSLINGYAEAQDAATGGSPSQARYPHRPRLVSTTQLMFDATGAPTTGENVSQGVMDAVSPFVWAANDAIRAIFLYEAG